MFDFPLPLPSARPALPFSFVFGFVWGFRGFLLFYFFFFLEENRVFFRAGEGVRKESGPFSLLYYTQE